MTRRSDTVGVLALHGDFAEHLAVLHQLKANAIEVRTVGDLQYVNRLIIPGGESTVISRLLALAHLREAVIRRHAKGSLPLFGTCAGIILLAKKIAGDHQPKTLGALDVTVDRNAYGRQIDSFEAACKVVGIAKPVNMRFIRAPKITRVGGTVEVLGTIDHDPVIVRARHLLGATGHPELCGETALHKVFLAL